MGKIESAGEDGIWYYVASEKFFYYGILKNFLNNLERSTGVLGDPLNNHLFILLGVGRVCLLRTQNGSVETGKTKLSTLK
ncbi:MAG: hypothetical protein EOM40_07020 [Clostridia bacterium]|nr:hypothetical protein [Clostridia bacterium]NCC43020.1 hypothetical protein [Clostridia bacterium]